MMNSNYHNALSITSQFSFCGLPFRLDTYSGCAFNCTYCFARLRGGNTPGKKLRWADPNEIITRFKTSLEQRAGTTGLISDFIRRRMPVHFGGMSDPFQPAEEHLQVSLQVLQYLCEIQYPTIISTRSVILSREPYLSLLKSNPNIVVQYSFSTTEDHLSEISEPYTFAPSALLRSIEELSRNGIKTTVRWQPYIPHVSEKPELFISRISGLGIQHLGFEHLKLPLEKSNSLWKKLADNLDVDIRSYYRENNGMVDGREMVLPAEYKLRKIKEVRSALKKHAISFGAADNEFQYLSDTDCCCSGIDRFPEFANWNKFQIAYAVKKSAFKTVEFGLIKDEWKPQGSIDKHLNSHSRIPKKKKHNRVQDYIADRWENLDSPFNPTRFYGVVCNGKRDAKGMRVFEWDQSKIAGLKE